MLHLPILITVILSSQLWKKLWKNLCLLTQTL